jgi:dihydrofolate reductase
MSLSIIAAVSIHGTIGLAGQLPWHLSSDLKRFKRLTMGHAIIMGRRTFESIDRALPGRQNIVVTRRELDVPNVEIVRSLPEAIQIAGDDAFVIGGAELYREALPLCDRVYLTRVETDLVGDTFFPLDVFDRTHWDLISDEAHGASPHDDFPFRFQVYRRRDRSTAD